MVFRTEAVNKCLDMSQGENPEVPDGRNQGANPDGDGDREARLSDSIDNMVVSLATLSSDVETVKATLNSLVDSQSDTSYKVDRNLDQVAALDSTVKLISSRVTLNSSNARTETLSREALSDDVAQLRLEIKKIRREMNSDKGAAGNYDESN